jgi:hypothetical protein
MSDTPRTDKEIVGELLVFASFARKLERELAAVTEERDRYKIALDKYSEDEATNTLLGLKQQLDMLAEALLWAKKEHDARIAMFAYDGPVISAEYERLGMHLMEVKHNATITRESALAAVKGGSDE